jgi:O-succinylbenzoate synthase
LAVFKGNPFAKSGLDLAWWDLHAQQLGQPLWRVLGGSRDTVAVGADFGVTDTVDELLRQIDAALAAGFPRVKLKFRPGWDLPMVRAVRQRFPDAVIHIDCNSGYRLSDLPLFQALDEFRLAMFEQPLNHDDVLDHAALRQQVTTPICLDESISSVEQARRALAVGACQYINIKPGRVGGLTNALQVHDLARAAGVACWIGGMLESAIGVAHCLALATLPNCIYPADIFPSSRFYHQDLGEPAQELCGPGQVRPLDRPGIGVVPHPDRLARLTLDHAVIDAGVP